MVGASSSSSNINYYEQLVDDFYFSALHEKDELFPISDEIYAEELQLQEALMSSSAICSALHDKDELFPISDEIYAEELQLQEALMSSSAICSKMMKTVSSPSPKMEVYSYSTVKKETGESSQSQNSSKMKTVSSSSSPKETGESSQSQNHMSFCFICMDAKSKEEMFTSSNNCSHSFCNPCIAKYVASRIQENISMVKCPDLDCKAILEPQYCFSFIPKEVHDRWENALSESLVLGSQKFYCPFKDCSAMLIDDGGLNVTASECPNCHRLFCAQCMVSWHVGITCKEFKELGKGNGEKKEDLMLLELAKNKKWRRCPNCKFYVEKNFGCLHINCRCGFEFCYGCGSFWSINHQCPPI